MGAIIPEQDKPEELVLPGNLAINVLSLSDRVVETIYSTKLADRWQHLDLVLGCGDLPYWYLEYVVSSLNKPVAFVRGNHDKEVEITNQGPRRSPLGAIDLHKNSVLISGAIVAGIEGSIRYKPGPFQYSQTQMWQMVFGLAPKLIMNRIRYGRFLDVFITHASPWGIHDRPDWPHQGVHAFRWLLNVFQPAYHFHGHIHLYGPNEVSETQFGPTRVINTYGARHTVLQIPDPQAGVKNAPYSWRL